MYPTDYILSKYLAKSNDFAAGEVNVWQDIYSGKINSDLVIYGSSRAWVHINPKIIEDSLKISSYNLGIDGHNFWLQYYRHKELLKFNRMPSMIILSLDIFTLQKRLDLYNYRQFLPFMLWDRDSYQYTSSYLGFSVYDYYIPLIRYFKESKSFIIALKCIMHYKTNPARVKGYMGKDVKWNNDLAKAKSKMDNFEIKPDSSTIKLFEEFIIECKKNGIKLMLVYSPEYIEGQNFVKNRKDIISKYQNFANKYDLQFIDFSNDTLSLKKDFFYNSEHLNKEGSAIFTKKLIKYIKHAWL